MQKITPCLWFNDNAEEAVSFYTSIFKNSALKLLRAKPLKSAGFLNAQGIEDYSRRLAERVDEVLGQGDSALVLGGTAAFCLGRC
jgi:uncharacterized glyoxalase superfamily protein PhnB